MSCALVHTYVIMFRALTQSVYTRMAYYIYKNFCRLGLTLCFIVCNIEGLGMGHIKSIIYTLGHMLWLHMYLYMYTYHYKHMYYVIYTMELIREQYLFWIQAWEGELEQAQDVDVDWEEQFLKGGK